MQTAGRHLLSELHGCDPSLLDDPARLEAALREAAAAVGAKIVAAHFHRFAPHGATGVLLLEESHLSVHTWPEHGYAAVDFYTCGSGDPETAHASIARALGATRTERMLVTRGDVARGLFAAERVHSRAEDDHLSHRAPQRQDAGA